MDDKAANEIQSAVTTPINITFGVQYGLIITGGFIMLSVLIYVFVERFRTSTRLDGQ